MDSKVLYMVHIESRKQHSLSQSSTISRLALTRSPVVPMNLSELQQVACEEVNWYFGPFSLKMDLYVSFDQKSGSEIVIIT